MNQDTQIVEERSGAEFSEDRKYRYALWRIWDTEKPLVMFIGLNPSTANESDNDPTIKSVCRIARSNGYGGVYMMNCFPLVSTNPARLIEFYDGPFHDVEDTENMRWLLEVRRECADVVFAWGNFNIVREKGRDKEFSEMLPNAKVLAINKNGSPKHPLYCKSNSLLIPYNSSNQK